ncbi:MAG: hypothetical protein QG585_453 [Patescibacteria group bacterium]|nr:hypothetical protein [Patescibacteria group bacterium]
MSDNTYLHLVLFLGSVTYIRTCLTAQEAPNSLGHTESVFIGLLSFFIVFISGMQLWVVCVIFPQFFKV